MKRKSSWLTALLVVMMLLAACSSNGGNTQGNKASDNAGAANNTDQGDKQEPTYELTMAYFSFGSVPKDLLLVQDEINKIDQRRKSTLK